MRCTPLFALVLIAALGCAAEPTASDFDAALLSKGKGGGGGGGTADPTATWLIPLDDSHLSFRSDGRYVQGDMSAYANGVCGVGTTIFLNGSGDATVRLDEVKGKNACSRRITLEYDDGYVETIRTFANLRKLQSTTLAIPIGNIELRTLAISPDHVQGQPSRCDRLLFGEGAAGNGAGSHPVWVHRTAADTWRVYSQDEPNNKALCLKTGDLFGMTVDFTIVASEDLPE